jgi:hypothetical protein
MNVEEINWRGPAKEGAMALTNYHIEDLISFNDVTGNPRQIAGLYFYHQLDLLVDLAHKVSYDFFARPKLYIDLGEVQEPGGPPRPLREILAQLHARFGYDEFFPCNPQRDEIFLPIFGRGGVYSAAEEGDFPRLRDALINAAAAFAERVFDTGVDMLRERVRTTVRVFRQYLRGVQGDSIKWSRENALSALTENVTYNILRGPGVAGVFGIRTPPEPNWPYIEDANGDKLIEAISRQLQLADRPDAHIVTWEQILNLQRVALRGAEAIATVIDFQEPGSNDELSLLITKCYTWGAALLSVAPTATQPPKSTATAQPTHATTMIRTMPYVMSGR